MKRSFALTTLLISQLASALNVSQISGALQEKTSPRGQTEVCAVANKLVPSAYSDKDLANEQELCAIDFYKTHALCPKQNSTNPGLLIAEIIKGKSREQTMTLCKGPDDDISVEAKFKNSISCSYTPSILAYYHFSRMFKAGRVPVSVLRTMDKDEHLQLAKTGSQMTVGGGVIHETWESFIGQHSKLNNDKIFDETRKFVYGALVENPKRELKYTEVSGVGSYDTRYQRFVQQAPYLKTADTRNVTDIVGSQDIKKIIPVVVQMKDVSDMVLLDTLFSQDDRIGNIHFKLAWYTVETNPQTGQLDVKNTKSKATLSSDKKTWIIPEEEKAIQAKGGVLVREMIMKDNDCGVNVAARSNMMRQVNALEGLKHMSARTYKKFMDFYKIAKNPETLNWMKKELLFTDADLGTSKPQQGKSFLANLEKAKSILVEGCKNGNLKLDLDLDNYLPNATVKQVSCE